MRVRNFDNDLFFCMDVAFDVLYLNDAYIFGATFDVRIGLFLPLNDELNLWARCNNDQFD